jgi:Inner membrane protein YgaP-like, transmembrane domain
MTVERGLRGVAGFFVLASLALGYWVHPAFFLFTAFVGANLFQSAFTNACPMMGILRRLGLQQESGTPLTSPPAARPRAV